MSDNFFIFIFLIYLSFNGFRDEIGLGKKARFVDDVYFIYFLPTCGFEGGRGGRDCTFDLAVRREGLVLGSALHE